MWIVHTNVVMVSQDFNLHDNLCNPLTVLGTYMYLGKKLTFIFFKNKLRKYVIIRSHRLKSDTDIAHIEPL
jgi:hypothetical protein